MKAAILIATASVAAMVAFGAQAQTIVYNTELGPLTGTGTTTTNASGTTSTNPANNLSNEAPGVDQWEQRNVRQGGVVGITTDYADDNGGNGSAYFSTNGTVPSKADLEYSLSTPILLSEFTGGSYDWFKDSASGNDSAPAPAFRFKVADTNGYAGYLIYEPYRNHAVIEDSWQTETINLTTSMFWSNNAGVALPDPCPNRQSCQYNLTTLANLNTDLVITDFSIGAGSGWTLPFYGAVDNVSYTFGNQTQAFDFEVAAVPEPGTWALMITGFGLAGAALRRRNKAALAA